MVSDLDIYRAANLLINQHGFDAIVAAARLLEDQPVALAPIGHAGTQVRTQAGHAGTIADVDGDVVHGRVEREQVQKLYHALTEARRLRELAGLAKVGPIKNQGGVR